MREGERARVRVRARKSKRDRERETQKERKEMQIHTPLAALGSVTLFGGGQGAVQLGGRGNGRLETLGVLRGEFFYGRRLATSLCYSVLQRVVV